VQSEREEGGEKKGKENLAITTFLFNIRGDVKQKENNANVLMLYFVSLEAIAS